ncbi:MAG: redoxin domain-containing protein [Verrucomicrobiae bacterium]|nr:redoxin domain-containing protein [Verrucomicrobiae bacterium]
MPWRKSATPFRGGRGVFLAIVAVALLVTVRPSPGASLMETRLRDEQGEPLRLSAFVGREKPCALLFVASTCPASALVWGRIKGVWYNHRDADLRMVLVGGNSDDSPEALRAALKEDPAELDLPILWDAGHVLATALGISSTPMAVLLAPDGTMLYRGPLDDNWRDGARAQNPWLENAVREALQGRASPFRDAIAFPGSKMR